MWAATAMIFVTGAPACLCAESYNAIVCKVFF